MSDSLKVVTREVFRRKYDVFFEPLALGEDKNGAMVRIKKIEFERLALPGEKDGAMVRIKKIEDTDKAVAIVQLSRNSPTFKFIFSEMNREAYEKLGTPVPKTFSSNLALATA